MDVVQDNNVQPRFCLCTVGGKAGNGTYQAIINHIPKCDVFIDAMVGNGGIFFNLNLPALTVINDIDRSHHRQIQR
jgi:hypothetical protein